MLQAFHYHFFFYFLFFIFIFFYFIIISIARQIKLFEAKNFAKVKRLSAAYWGLVIYNVSWISIESYTFLCSYDIEESLAAIEQIRQSTRR